jgi:putative FmdB family regulatory protein
MPIYEYRCENGHTFEVMQKMTDDPVTTCPEDGSSVQRVFHPVAVHFKGSGFYNTDYGKKTSGAAAPNSDSGGGSSSESKSTSESSSSSSSSESSSSSSSSSSD